MLYNSGSHKCKVCKDQTILNLPSNALILLGDVFYSLSCEKCSPSRQVLFERELLSWRSATYLVLYHLTHSAIRSSSSSSLNEKGRKSLKDKSNYFFFRWKEDICAFMEDNWHGLLPGKMQNTASTNWQNSVSSVLSANGDLFANGLDVIGEQGWWRLVDMNKPPASLSHHSSFSLSTSSNSNTSKKLKSGDSNETSMSKRQKVSPPSITDSGAKLTATNDSCSSGRQDDLKEQLLKKLLSVDKSLLTKALNSNVLVHQTPSALKKTGNDSINSSEVLPLKNKVVVSSTQASTPASSKKNNPSNPVPPSRFITVVEAEILKKCLAFVNPPWQIRQLTRKILNRRAKRSLGFPVFDIDSFIYGYLKSDDPLYITDQLPPNTQNSKVSQAQGRIDDIIENRRIWPATSILSRNPEMSFRTQILGISSVIDGWPEVPIESPYTGHRLPAVVTTLSNVIPPQLALLHELEIRNRHQSGDPDKEAVKESLEYIKVHHLRKEFVPQINRLLRDSFWPRIDTSEHLENPDYALVALYKLKVVGVGLLNPDGYLEFLAVERGWQGSGLAKNLLFLLVQKSPPKDITLHVAPDNFPAMLLYQQFGFKVDRYVLDFYNKYFPPEYTGTRNAFFMRLRR